MGQLGHRFQVERRVLRVDVKEAVPGAARDARYLSRVREPHIKPERHFTAANGFANRIHRDRNYGCGDTVR